MCKWGQFHDFYRKLRSCMPVNAVCIVLVKLKRIFPSNRDFSGCLIRISVKVLFHDIFVLRLHLDRNDSKIVSSIMIL